MQDFVYCCGFEQSGKRYDLPTSNKVWKRLYFLDECALCHKPVASLQECDKNGIIKIVKRFTGQKALEFKDKLTKKILKFNNPKQGSLENERTLFNDSGKIINFNGRIISSNEEFLKIIYSH